MPKHAFSKSLPKPRLPDFGRAWVVVSCGLVLLALGGVWVFVPMFASPLDNGAYVVHEAGFRTVLLGIGAGVSAIGVFACALTLGPVTRAVETVSEAAMRMREGLYNEPVDIGDTNELGDLAIAFNGMREAVAGREREIFDVAHHDSLSGLPTRDAVVGRLRDMVRSHDAVAVAEFSIDRFDRLVSTFGQQACDRIVRALAALVPGLLEDGGVLGQLSSRRFVALMPGADVESAVKQMLGVRHALEEGLEIESAVMATGISAGIACYPADANTAPDLLRRAAAARIRADEAGKPVEFHDEAGEAFTALQGKLVNEFAAALDRAELELVYQPRIHAPSGAVTGVEALVRWNHPSLGILLPGEFLRALELAGLDRQLTREVLNRAVSQCSSWRRRGVEMPVTVSLSAGDLTDPDLPRYLDELCGRYGLDARLLTMRVASSAFDDTDPAVAGAAIRRLRSAGLRICLDGLLAGRSKFDPVLDLPADEVSIAPGITARLGETRADAIVAAVAALASAWEADIIAVGIEDGATADHLRALGIGLQQGHYHARPLGAAAFIEWLAARAGSEPVDLTGLIGALR